MSKVKELKAAVEALQAEAAARDADEATKRSLRERCAGAEAEVVGLKKQLSRTEARAATGAAAAVEAETLRKELDAKVRVSATQLRARGRASMAVKCRQPCSLHCVLMLPLERGRNWLRLAGNALFARLTGLTERAVCVCVCSRSGWR